MKRVLVYRKDKGSGSSETQSLLSIIIASNLTQLSTTSDMRMSMCC